jgi:alcohol dehydrogenase
VPICSTAANTLLPFVVIPTTAGTGSEVTKVAVIADPDNDVKLPFAEEQFLPQLAILDPEMTVSLPGKLTAATGYGRPDACHRGLCR